MINKLRLATINFYMDDKVESKNTILEIVELINKEGSEYGFRDPKHKLQFFNLVFYFLKK